MNLKRFREELQESQREARVFVSLVIAIVAGWLCAAKADAGTDFEFFWRATRLFADGVSPYTMRAGALEWPLPDPFFYPAPALIVVWPLHQLSLAAAAGVFMGVAAGLLAWRLSADGLWRLWMLGTPSFLMAVTIGQWSPLITLAAILPAAGFLLSCKPTLGIAAFAYKPTWRAAVSVGVIAILCFVLLPGWPQAWLANLSFVEQHPLPITMPLGWLVLAALLRWRQAEARLLIAMACVPQLLFFADQLALGLVARTRRETVAMAVCGVAAFTGWWAFVKAGDSYVIEAQPFVMAGFYLPALVIVLMRPSEGVLPRWLEKSFTARGWDFRREA